MKKAKRERSPIKESKEEQLTKYLLKYDKYPCVLYNSTKYEIGDCFMANNYNRQYRIGRLLKIIPLNGIAKYNWPSIKVQWYYSKKQIDRKKNGLTDTKKYNCISNHELFASNKTEIILIENIISKCYVIPIDTYLQLSKPSKNIYFTRAKYNNDSSLINPPFQTWETVCVCNTPHNPDQQYCKCYKCKKYYHPHCINIVINDIKEMEQFYCNDCKEENINSEIVKSH